MRKRDTMATKKKSAAKKQQQPDRTYPKGVEVLSSKVSFEGPVFRVVTDEVREPGGEAHRRDVVRHPGSVVVFAVDDAKSKRDPLILLERQYRHAAAQYLYEIPAGSLDPGEDPLVGAKRELLEETGYKAKHWSKLVRFYASPGFLGEWMQIFVAESLTPGDAAPFLSANCSARSTPGACTTARPLLQHCFTNACAKSGSARSEPRRGPAAGSRSTFFTVSYDASLIFFANQTYPRCVTKGRQAWALSPPRTKHTRCPATEQHTDSLPITARGSLESALK
jgi:ADP-ribose pyrophosphatase